MLSADDKKDGGSIAENPLYGMREQFVNQETGLLDVESVLREAVAAIHEVDPELRLDGVRRFVVSNNYLGALQVVGEEIGRKVQPTQRSSGNSIAMVLPAIDHDILVMDSMLLELLFLPDSKAFFTSINMLHHELSHSHDHSTMRKDLAHEFLVKQISGKRKYFNQMAMSIWSEYFANRRSYKTLFQGECIHANLLAEEVEKIGIGIKEEVRKYRTSKNLNGLLEFVVQNAGYLFQLSGYVLGSLSGEGVSIEERYPEVWERISTTPLGKIWGNLEHELGLLYERHGSWGSFDALIPIEVHAENLINEYGLNFEERPQGLWVNVPFRW